jgi:general secretion pathway protein K
VIRRHSSASIARRCARPVTARSARGAALLLVLWLIALMTAVVGAFALNARIEHLQGRVLSRGVVADEAARAGLEYAMTRVIELEPRRQWRPDGREQPWRYGDAEITVTIVDETGKIDLNAADAPLLAELIRVASSEQLSQDAPRQGAAAQASQGSGDKERAGADPVALAQAALPPPDPIGQEQARALASAILDWRDPDSFSQAEGGAEDPQYAAEERPYGAKDAPFETVAELQLVLGMTPALVARLTPYLTVYSGQPRPNQEYAAPAVLEAMGLDAEPIMTERNRQRLPGESGALVGAGTGTYSIESRARLRDGRVAVLRAVVRAGNSGLPGSAYTPLRWEQGALPR